MMTLKKWLEKSSDFVPLRMTIRGIPGSGKSTVIKFLRRTMHQIFGQHACTLTCAPTGNAAHNVQGETIHRSWEVSRATSSKLSPTARKCLISRMSRLVLLIVDECSLLDAQTLGSMHKNAQATVHKGRNPSESWGGIPIVLFFGDHFQLPSINPGVFESMDETLKNKILSRTKSELQKQLMQEGWQEFFNMTAHVCTLNTSHRISTTNTELQSLMTNIRGKQDQDITDEQAQCLLNLHLNTSGNFSSLQRQEIMNKALFLTATKESRDRHNVSMTKEESTQANCPVAICKSITTKHNMRRNNNDHHDDDRTPSLTFLVIGQRIQLNGWNIAPSWGLCHGSIGKIVDVVFEKDKSPNTHDLPLYVICDFPDYKGPIFDEKHRSCVPIPSHVQHCLKGCGCQRIHVPLFPAYAKTIHSCQGINVGPTDEGKPDNPIQNIVADPGTRRFESTSPGLFNTLLGRITTLGDPLDLMTSSIHFVGPNMTEERIRWITKKKDRSAVYQKVQLRTLWKSHLDAMELQTTQQTQSLQTMFNWWSTTEISDKQLLHVIDFWSVN